MMAVLTAVRNGSSEGDVKEENVCPRHAVPPVVWKKTYNKTKRVYKNVGCRFEGESNGNGGFLEHAKEGKKGMWSLATPPVLREVMKTRAKR